MTSSELTEAGWEHRAAWVCVSGWYGLECRPEGPTWTDHLTQENRRTAATPLCAMLRNLNFILKALGGQQRVWGRWQGQLPPNTRDSVIPESGKGVSDPCTLRELLPLPSSSSLLKGCLLSPAWPHICSMPSIFRFLICLSFSHGSSQIFDLPCYCCLSHCIQAPW